MRKLMIVGFAICIAGGAVARTNTLVNGASDWTKGTSYIDTSFVPGDGDFVIVPADAKVYLNASTDADSLAIVTNLERIAFASANSTLEITVAAGDEIDIPVPITGYRYMIGATDYKGGPIVKKGLGTLNLSAANKLVGADSSCEYYSRIVVEEGVLKLQQNFGRKFVLLGDITVAADATFWMPWSGVSDAAARLRTLSGAGTVTNVLDGFTIRFEGLRKYGAAEFSGLIAGQPKLNFQPNIDSQDLTGTESRFATDITFGANSRVGFASLGTSTTGPSSFGLASRMIYMPNTSNEVVYVGTTGETTPRQFIFESQANAPGPAIVNAGDHGGLVFTGLWQRRYTSQGGRRVVLRGSNTVNACVLNNPINDNTTGADPNNKHYGHTLYFAKEGTGIWRFADREDRKNFASGISVNEGTLQYESLAEKGEVCSLGVATNLTDGTSGSTDTNAEHRVDYAIRLGAPTLSGESKTSGRLEYIGTTKSAFTRTRKIALAGSGGFTANGEQPVVYAAGTYGLSSEPMTLHLDGTSTVENTVMDVSDGAGGGKVSICKDGTGSWTLGGNLTFTGDIAVKGGTLTISRPTYYTWFRWTVSGLYGSTAKLVQFYELGYFDADGANQVLDTEYATNVYQNVSVHYEGLQGYLPLKPGSAGFHMNATYNAGDGSGDSAGYKLTLERAFDGLYNGVGLWGVKYTLSNYPMQSNHDTWVPITVRLRDDAKEIAGFDFANVGGTWNADTATTCISNCTVEASLDGVHWDVLTNMTAALRHYDGGMWSCQGGYSDGEETHKTRFTDSFPNRNDHYNAYPLAGRPSTLPTVNDPVGVVAVSGGGTLKMGVAGGPQPLVISKLALDAASGGTIDGFAFAEDGELTVDNVSGSQSVELPVRIINATGRENLANWTLQRPGGASLNRGITVTEDGAIVLTPRGLAIIVR